MRFRRTEHSSYYACYNDFFFIIIIIQRHSRVLFIKLLRAIFLYFFFFLVSDSYTLFTFVDVFGTIDSFVTGRTRTCVRTVYRTRVADCVGVTRVGRARVVEVAKETCKKRQKKHLRSFFAHINRNIVFNLSCTYEQN